MTKQPAKVLETAEVRRVLRHIESHRYPARDAVMVLLSFKAGLRACEIAGLTWPMVLTSGGRVGDTILIARQIAKRGRARRLPAHADLRAALSKLHELHGRPNSGPVIPSERGGHMTARGVVNWFGDVYRRLGFNGCSSHSGRRTFITKAARLLARSGGSLRDIQELAGHRALTTTERYIAGDRTAQRKLITMI